VWPPTWFVRVTPLVAFATGRGKLVTVMLSLRVNPASAFQPHPQANGLLIGPKERRYPNIHPSQERHKCPSKSGCRWHRMLQRAEWSNAQFVPSGCFKSITKLVQNLPATLSPNRAAEQGHLYVSRHFGRGQRLRLPLRKSTVKRILKAQRAQ